MLPCICIIKLHWSHWKPLLFESAEVVLNYQLVQAWLVSLSSKTMNQCGVCWMGVIPSWPVGVSPDPASFAAVLVCISIRHHLCSARLLTDLKYCSHHHRSWATVAVNLCVCVWAAGEQHWLLQVCVCRSSSIWVIVCVWGRKINYNKEKWGK